MASKFYCLLLMTIYSAPSISQSIKSVEYRLPLGAVDVINYKIGLRLDTDIFETNRFYGDVEVLFTNLNETNVIKIHANKITFDEIVLKQSEGNEIAFESTDFAIDNVTDILTLTTSVNLTAESVYHLSFINYSAILRSDDLFGFYKSSYVASDGSTRYLGSTQFEQTHARKAFPCFDEPLYKATFDINIRHSSEYSALSNTAGSSQPDFESSSYTITTFATTPRMSTYLVAFVISDLTCTSGEPIEQYIPHTVCSRPAAESTRTLALEVGPKLMHAVENYTGVAYSVSTLTKIHEVAIPDFPVGAMENWGLVTYRESALLWDHEESSNRYKQRVETVIAHELGHFWFGNLVTCHWWSDVFLNEGPATYFEFFATNEVEPDWQMENQFVIEELYPVLISDASSNATPLSMDASSPSEVAERSGLISYSKGGAVFRMIRYFMGLDNFKKALYLYLDTNKFKAVTPAHLWSALEAFEPNGLPSKISELIQNWVVQGGYPLITVTQDGQDVKLTQKRYLSNTTETSGTTWYVPISYTTSSDANKFENTTPSVWLQPSDTEIILENVLQTDNDWIILNNQQTGYYRVTYSSELWENIQTALKKENFDGISEINRAQLVDDLYSFASYGYRTFTEVMKFYEFLENDTSYFSWYAASTAFDNIIIRIEDENIKESFLKYLVNLIKVAYESHPFNDVRDDNQIYTHNKVLILSWACRLGLEDCIDNCLSAFANYRDSGITPNKNLKSVVYCNGLRYSTEIYNDWNFLWNKFLNTTLSTEQVTILTALGCATDATVLRDYLRKSIDLNSGIRTQDAVSVFTAVYTNNPEGVDVAFDFLLENFQEISTGYGTMNSISSVFDGLATRFTRKEQLDKLEEFITSNDLGEHVTAVQSALETAQLSLQMTERFEDELEAYFDGAGDNNDGDSIFLNKIVVSFFIILIIY